MVTTFQRQRHHQASAHSRRWPDVRPADNDCLSC